MFPAPFCDSLRVLQPPVLETEEVFEIEVNKTPEPQPWIPQGSEREVDEEADRETRERVLQCIKKIFFPHSASSVLFTSPFRLLLVISCGTSSPEYGGISGRRSVFPTATLQTLRTAT